jgi:hypothetical protein
VNWLSVKSLVVFFAIEFDVNFMFCRWVSGSKSLTLNLVVSILLDFRKTGDWTESFVKNLPKSCYDANYVPKKSSRKR